MLQKKSGKTKASVEQKYIHRLIRDAAKSTHIWYKTPLLNEISQRKRDFFFELIVQQVPGLGARKETIWRILGQMLQNRRKYIHDKDVGKRQKVTKDMKDTTNKPVNEQPLIGSGQKVNLKSGSGCYVGTGIYVRKIDALFSEVVLTGVSNNAESVSDIDLELPAPVDGELTRITRTPAFWGYPPRPHDYPHYWVILDPKSKK